MRGPKIGVQEMVTMLLFLPEHLDAGISFLPCPPSPRVHQEAGIINRVSALEARAYRRAKPVQMLYLLLIFVVYGVLLGTVYYQTHNPTFTLSAFGVFSCASGLFMFPAVYTYLFRAIEVRGVVVSAAG